MKRVVLLVVPLIAAIVLGSSGCSIALQDSVRSSSVYCSTSYAWAAGDLILAGSGVFAMSRGGDASAIGPTVGLFVASAAIGLYKRHHCADFREHAPPEVWAAAEAARQQQLAAEAAQREANEQAAREALAAAVAAQAQQVADQQTADWQQQQQQQQPAPQDGSPPPQRTTYVQRNTNVSNQSNTNINVQRTVVQPSGTPARDRGQCDGILPLPAATKNDPFGNAQTMQRMNRDGCYKCIASGKTYYMEAPPPGLRYNCQ